MISIKSIVNKRWSDHKRLKTDCTIQMEGAECGAASLCTILKYYGKYVPLSELRQTTGVSRDGAKAKNIISAAKSYGLDAFAIKANRMYLDGMASYPAIAFWGYNHFLVIESFDKDHAYLADPAEGRYRVKLDYFFQKFTGVLIELKPNNTFVKSGKKSYNLSKVPELVYPYRKTIFVYFLVVAVRAIPLLIVAGSISVFTDLILLQGKFDLALPTFWVVLTAALVAFVLQLLSQVIERRLTYLMTKDLAAQAFQKLQTVPLSFLETRFIGELAQRAMLAIQIPQMISGSIISFIANIIVSLGILFIVAFISLPIGLLFIIAFGMNTYIVIATTRSRLDLNVSYAIAAAEANAITFEGLGNLEVLKSCGLEFDFVERWIDKYVRQINQSQNLLRDTAKTSVLAIGTKYFLSAAVLSMGGFLIFYTSELTIGSLISLQFLVAMISTPFAAIPKILYSLQMLDGQLGRLIDLLDNKDDELVIPSLTFSAVGQKRAVVTKAPLEQLIKPESGKKLSICLESVSFQYNPKLPVILSDINLDFDESNHLAIVGTSGSGKSTLLKILAGFLVPSAGRYLINGQIWSKADTYTVRQLIGYIPQTPTIFNGTIRDNLTLYDPSFTDQQIFEACKLTTVDRVVSLHSQGLDYFLTDNGSNLSGGQRQLVEITRAVLRKPEILLLDEATSALDGQTESILLNNLWKSNFRTVSIAHRLLSAKMGDRIIYIDNGCIVEDGNPSELLNSPNSMFSQLSLNEKE